MARPEEPAEIFDDAGLSEAVGTGDLEAYVHRAYLALEAPEWAAFVQRAVALHRSGGVDLLVALEAKAEGRLPYSVEQLLGELLPDLDIPIERMFRLASHLSGRWRGEGVPYFLRNTFSQWCDRSQDRPDVALAAIRSGAAPAELLIPTLLAGMRAAQTRWIGNLAEMLSSPSLEEADAAANVLGWAVPESPEARRRIYEILTRAMDEADADRLTERFRALLSLSLGATEDEPIALAAVAAVRGRATPAIRTAAANSLFMDRKGATRASIAAICDLLAGTEAGEAATTDAIDHLLYGMLDKPEADLALDLLSRLLREERATLKQLDSTAHHIMTSKNELHLRLVVDWLVDGDAGMIGAVHDLVMLLANDPPTFNLDFSGRGLDAEGAAAIGRRSISSLILFPQTAASILASLLRSGPPDAAPLIEDMLFDPLLISYWETPRAYLEGIAPAERPETAALIARVLSRLDGYIADVEAAGIIRELRPSERHRFIAAVQRAELHRSIAKGASKGALASLFPTSMLLYGDSAVGDVFGADGSGSRNEFRLGSYETSQEIARLDSIDPIGLWYQRMLFSMGKARG